MDREFIEERQVVERYLAGKLSAEETEQFETRLLWCETTREDLELAEKLKQGLTDVAAEGEYEVAQRPAWLSVFLSPAYAFAATVLMVVGFGGWFIAYQGAESMPSGFASTRVFSIEATRGLLERDSLPIVRSGAPDEWLTLLVYPDFADYSRFHVSLQRDEDGRWAEVWKGEQIPPGNQDSLAVIVPGAKLTPGQYRIQVGGWKADWAAGREPAFAGEVYFRAE